jgi:hypothetical protein
LLCIACLHRFQERLDAPFDGREFRTLHLRAELQEPLQFVRLGERRRRRLRFGLLLHERADAEDRVAEELVLVEVAAGHDRSPILLPRKVDARHGPGLGVAVHRMCIHRLKITGGLRLRADKLLAELAEVRGVGEPVDGLALERHVHERCDRFGCALSGLLDGFGMRRGRRSVRGLRSEEPFRGRVHSFHP